MEQARTRKSICRKQGFTLIELLIVVAIIAILAAIAVPNFLEAQTRSKVSRTLADMRTIRTGLETYYVDNNKYPETDQGTTAFSTQGLRTYFRLTTPVAYLTSIPQSAFKEKYGTGGSPKVASTINGYLYVRKKLLDSDPDADTNYQDDRLAYVIQGALTPPGERRKGEWLMKSVGPDNIDDRQNTAPGYGTNARVYDPTNGTTSRGDIVTFSDISGTGKNQ